MRYPGTRAKCDVAIDVGADSRFWLEIKGAWKEWWRRRSESIYRSYLLHPLVPGLDESKTHTVPLDLRKLATLESPTAQHVGVLLVGFATEAPMDDDVHEQVQLAGLHHG